MVDLSLAMLNNQMVNPKSQLDQGTELKKIRPRLTLDGFFFRNITGGHQLGGNWRSQESARSSGGHGFIIISHGFFRKKHGKIRGRPQPKSRSSRTGCGLRSIAMVKLWVKPFWWLRFRSHLFWLVVDLPLWKMMEFVRWDDELPNIWKNKKY